MKFTMGGNKEVNETPDIPEDDESFDPDKCNSCPPSYELSNENGAFSSRLSLARTNSNASLNSTGPRANSLTGKLPMGRSASSQSFNLDKAKSKSLSRSMSITSFSNDPANQGRMSRAMSTASFYFDSIKDEFEDDSDVALQYTRHERMPIKNFGADIRATSDVESFVKSATLFLDLDESNLEGIIDTMLEKVIDEEESQTTVHEAKLDIFTHDSVSTPAPALLTQCIQKEGPGSNNSLNIRKMACLAMESSAHHLSKTMQGTYKTPRGGMDYDQQWITILCTLPTLQRRHVAIARLKTAANLGRTSQDVRFIILVATPTRQKGTKTALEFGRTFSTLFTDMEFRYRLQNASSDEDFTAILWEHTKQLAIEQREAKKKAKMTVVSEEGVSAHSTEEEEETMKCVFGHGISQDLKRRWPFYISDFVDGFIGPRTLTKTFSTTFFLYFSVLLPTIALGHLNDYETDGKIGVKEAIYGQTIAGFVWAFLGGQPMVVLLTTAPLAIYVKIIYSISDDLGYEFLPMYALVGVWNGFFCIVFALLDVSKIMDWARRSTEEVFAMFVAVAFTVDAGKGIYKEFKYNYLSDYCKDADKYEDKDDSGYGDKDDTYGKDFSNFTSTTPYYTSNYDGYNSSNGTGGYGDGDGYYEPKKLKQCLRENSMLHLMLALGTVWLGLLIYRLTKTPFLNTTKRELLASYALPVAVLIMSFFGTYVFSDIDLKPFAYSKESVFKFTDFEGMDIGSGFVGMGLGFCLSLLFMVDQHECAGLVNIEDHKLKKGNAYHWDLLVVGILNVFLACFGFPMVHGALPQSPLHVRAMADMEDRVEEGRIKQVIMRVRETRMTNIFSHILIGLSVMLLPYPLKHIPKGVLDGVFLYLAIAGLDSSQMFERILLLFTEQAAYPPNHYIRSVPQRKLHLFTLMQILQLGAMCGIGFSPIPYLKMTFPVLIICLLPVRHNLIPLFIEHRYLTAMDGHH